MSAVADKLRAARTLVERGWVQGDYSRGPCVCTLGALNAAFGDDPNTDTRSNKWFDAKKLLESVVETPFLDVWNDEPGRTQGEVLAAFDKAIELAEQSA